jgi:AAA domain
MNPMVQTPSNRPETSSASSSSLGTASVLADRYVPAKKRKELFYSGPNVVTWYTVPLFDTVAAINLSNQIFHFLVPPPMISTNLIESKPPPIRSVLPIIQEEGNVQDDGGDLVLASTDELSSIQQYVSTWETILRQEHAVITKLYERYSQYNTPIRIADSPPRITIQVPTGFNDMSPPPRTGDFLIVRPSQPVSLPVSMIAPPPVHQTPPPFHPQAPPRFDTSTRRGNGLPPNHGYPPHQPPHFHPPQQHRGWTARNQILEIRAYISNVTKHASKQPNSSPLRQPPVAVTDKSGRPIALNDLPEALNSLALSTSYCLIHGTWLVPDLAGILRQQQNSHELDYHVRIIPDTKSLIRTLTALDWLRATVFRSNSGTSHAIASSIWHVLFPTTAPILPPLLSNDCEDDAGQVPHSRPNNGSYSVSDQRIRQQLSPPWERILLRESNGSSSFIQNVKQNSARNDESETSIESSLLQLNDKQLSFVRLMIRRTKYFRLRHGDELHQPRGPVILTGAAGTGKTSTLLTTIQCILDYNSRSRTNGVRGASKQTYDHLGEAGLDGTIKRTPRRSPYRILVCTPSHTACDVITRRLSKVLDDPKRQLFRLYDADRPLSTVPIELLQFCCQSTAEATDSFALPTAAKLLSYEVIVSTCLDSHLLYRAGLTNSQLLSRRRTFRDTLRSACVNANLNCFVDSTDNDYSVEELHFSHLFIDEAAQATEPESLIPLSVILTPDDDFGIEHNGGSRYSPGAGTAEIALVGDPRQLQPAVYSRMAAAAGLNQSWMERLLSRRIECLGGGNKDLMGPEPPVACIQDWLRYTLQANDGQEQLSIFLTLNYRGHPSVSVGRQLPFCVSIEWNRVLLNFVSFFSPVPYDAIRVVLLRQVTDSARKSIHGRIHYCVVSSATCH